MSTFAEWYRSKKYTLYIYSGKSYPFIERFLVFLNAKNEICYIAAAFISLYFCTGQLIASLFHII